MSQSDAAVLIGFGSIGRRHAPLLVSRSSRLAIVDSRADALDAARREQPEATLAQDLADLDGLGWPWAETVAVIATWGPSHAEVFGRLVEHGVRRVLCEKPLASSLSDAQGMVGLARRRDVALGVNMQRRHAGIAAGLRRLSAQHALGEPVSVIVHGGARCLVTNGIHYIDFASELFGVPPSSVVSDARGDAINPRSPDLRYYEGTGSWMFPTGARAAMTFSNRSSVTAPLLIYYRDAIAVLPDSNRVTIERRDAAATTVTRTGIASERIYEGDIPGSIWGDSAIARALDEVIAARVRTLPPEVALDALGACVGALASGESGARIELPISPKSSLGRRRWPIS
jgi:predicted dehydrogenase